MDKKVEKFAHLHTHSHFSLLDGVPTIDELIKEAKEQGMDAVGLTDHGVMYGAVKLYKKAKEAGIKPIIGVEGYLAAGPYDEKGTERAKKRYHITLLAENNTGYKNLMELTTKAHLEGFYYKPRIDKNLLRKHNEGIICLSGCLQGEIPKSILADNEEKTYELIDEYIDIFGEDNFFLEIQPERGMDDQIKVNEKLKEISKEKDMPLAATCDSHYLYKEDKEPQDIMIAIQTQSTVKDNDKLSVKEIDQSFLPLDEINEEFDDTPEAIENTKKIATRCNVELDLDKTILPEFEVPNGKDYDSYLKDLCEKGIEKRYKNNPDTDISIEEVEERLEFELDTITNMGFSAYFLIVQDLVKWAKDQGIAVGPGRGSAAGSLVSYLLGITDVDPLKHDLLFTRFLNPNRVSMPDIDIDFDDKRRGEVMEYAKEKYGEDHVAQMITFGTMAARGAIRDVGRALDYSYDYCDKVAKMIPFGSSLQETLDESEEFMKLYQTDQKARKLIDMAQRLEGAARHSSTHACAIVITKEELTNYTPLQYADTEDDDETIVTQYDMYDIEDLGLLKMDILGLKNLTIIQDTLNIIEKTKGDEIDIKEIPMDDDKTFELLQQGKTTGIFQLESDGMTEKLKDLEPTEFDDVIAMIALYRPGPLESGMVDKYIKRKNGEEEVEYMHPSMEGPLKDTYGIMVYQEQLMQIAREVAGFSMEEADVLRKAVGKKKEKLLEAQKEKFIKGVEKTKGDKKLGKDLWELIEPFARYGFNKSHAVSYGTIGYRTAYLKAHYPTEFFAALLNARQGDVEKVGSIIKNANEMDIEVLAPDVNESYGGFTVTNDKTIRFGLQAIKHVGEAIVEDIIEERKENGEYEDIIDFTSRLYNRGLNKGSVEALAKSGALDSISDKEKVLANLKKIRQVAKEKADEKENNQSSLFGNGDDESDNFSVDLTETKDISGRQELSWEKRYLGLFISSHPLETLDEDIKDQTTNIESVKDQEKEIEKPLVATVAETKKINTKNGKPMMFVTIEDVSDKIEIVVFPDTLNETKGIWEEGNIVLLAGEINERQGEKNLICKEAKLVK